MRFVYLDLNRLAQIDQIKANNYYCKNVIFGNNQIIKRSVSLCFIEVDLTVNTKWKKMSI